MKLAAYITMTFLAGAAIAFACFIVTMSGVAIYDSNFDVFHHKVNEAERAGIIKTASELLSMQVLLLIVTNLLWIVGVGVALWRSRNGTAVRNGTTPRRTPCP